MSKELVTRNGFIAKGLTASNDAYVLSYNTTTGNVGYLNAVTASAITSEILNTVNTFNKAQRGRVYATTSNATQSLDFSLGNNYKIVLTSASTLLANPINVGEGQSGVINVRQDIAGSRLLIYGNYFEFIGGTLPTLSTGKLAFDNLIYYVNYFTQSSVTATTSNAPGSIYWVSHGLVSGQKVQFLTSSTFPTSIPSLTHSTQYWTSYVDDNYFRLSTSYANAQNLLYVTISSTSVLNAVAASITLTTNLNIS